MVAACGRLWPTVLPVSPPLLLVLLAGGLPLVTAPARAPGSRQLVLLRRDASASTMSESRVAVFAAGCFWGVELALARIPGVIYTEVGYTGGNSANPTYRAVAAGTSGHAEAVRVGYDPSQLTYTELLEVFFDVHDPTSRNRQGNDVGTQYRSAIFVSTEEEQQTADTAIKAEAERLGKPLATTIEELTAFYPAEQYHQQYLVKSGQTAAKGSLEPIRCYG